MLRNSLLGLVILMTFFTACNKSNEAMLRSEVFVKYSGEEEQLVIEEVNGQWSNGTIVLIADGYDHEQLKIYLLDIKCTGDIKKISEQNISFSDGLDFASTKLLEGVMTITDMDEEKVCGRFTVSLLDDVGGVETRGIEGGFIVRKN
jgi:hypothetical protein